MNDKKHTASRLLTAAGGLMAVSGILMAVCADILYGGIMWAGAACMFFAAANFRRAEDNKISEAQSQEKQSPTDENGQGIGTK